MHSLKYDVFICHASEDKQKVVLPLANALEHNGIKCWLDQIEILWGDSIIAKVNEGIAKSKYAIIVLSKNIINKNWPQRELNSVLNIEASQGIIKVLPLLVGNTDDINEIMNIYPLLNDKRYIIWDGNPRSIIDELSKRINKPTVNESQKTTHSNIPIPNIKKEFTQRDRDIFIKEAYTSIKLYFQKALNQLEKQYSEIETDMFDINNIKFGCKLYKNGELKNECMIWIGGIFSKESISYLEGNQIDYHSTNTLNESLIVEQDYQRLYLNASGMSIINNNQIRNKATPEDAAEFLWLRFIDCLSF